MITTDSRATVSSALADGLTAAPGVAVGILLILAAIAWFSPYQRWKIKRAVLGLVVAAIAAIVIFGYLGAGS